MAATRMDMDTAMATPTATSMRLAGMERLRPREHHR